MFRVLVVGFAPCVGGKSHPTWEESRKEREASNIASRSRKRCSRPLWPPSTRSLHSSETSMRSGWTCAQVALNASVPNSYLEALLPLVRKLVFDPKYTHKKERKEYYVL